MLFYYEVCYKHDDNEFANMQNNPPQKPILYGKMPFFALKSTMCRSSFSDIINNKAKGGK